MYKHTTTDICTKYTNKHTYILKFVVRKVQWNLYEKDFIQIYLTYNTSFQQQKDIGTKRESKPNNTCNDMAWAVGNRLIWFTHLWYHGMRLTCYQNICRSKIVLLQPFCVSLCCLVFVCKLFRVSNSFVISKPKLIIV